MSYESVMPAAEHPGLAESITLCIGPEQLQPDPLIVVRPQAARPAEEEEQAVSDLAAGDDAG